MTGVDVLPAQKYPAGHDWGAAAGAGGQKKPGGHVAGNPDPALQYCPNGHMTGDTAAEGQKYPNGQVVQSEVLPPPAVARYLPAGHAVGLVLPVGQK